MLLAIILLPLLGFTVLGLFGRRFPEPWPGYLASFLVFASLILSLLVLTGGGSSFTLKDWVPGVPFSLRMDHLSAYMSLIITGVGFLIHVYSIGYMRDDPGVSRFFAYMNFFIAMMMILVLADSYPLMFVGWEGVGLSSYLLIGFWYQEKLNADSARKAFIVNRIGDLGFLLAMGLLYHMFGTLSISALRGHIDTTLVLPVGLGLAGFFLLVGAVGKSAQIPLMVWLPDAMAGPTPVSALIHAATMVTAGVYLLARSSFLYANLPDISYLIAWIGLLTALYGGIVALGQWDIKKIIAYSTISQLGYMFLAIGVGAYWIALFQVLTHAFFKALLFLTAGSVIHGAGGEQDVRRMGGLRKYMPHTHIHGLIGALALAGIPILAGFWSKDAIVSSALYYPFGGTLLWVGALVAAAFTALYAMRWYTLVFLGEFKGKHPPHEAPMVMLWPNYVLAIGAVLIGLLALPKPFWNILEPFLAPALAHMNVSPLSEGADWGLLLLGAGIAVAGLYVALYFFGQKRFRDDKQMPKGYRNFQRWSSNALYVDLVYNSLIANPIKELAYGLGELDRFWDNFVVWLSGSVGLAGQGLARMQVGYVRVYAGVTFLGLVAFVLWGVLR